MEKDIFFLTQTWFESKIFDPKNCINYDKPNLQQNNIKGPKDPNRGKNAKKVTYSFKMCQKKMPEKAQNHDITHFLDKTV